MSVTIYQHANFQGASQSLDVGRYDIGQLTIGNDQLSSVRVPAGYKVTLYQHADFQGASVSYTDDVTFVGAFNDQTSSIVVERVTPGGLPPIGSWEHIGGKLKWVEVGADGAVWGVNSSDDIWTRSGEGWTHIGGKLKQISVGSAQHVWGVNSNDDIWMRSGGTWTHIAGKLMNVSVGSDGTVWGVNSAQQIWRYKGNNQWDQIGGALVQVSCGDASNVWGVNSADQIWRWNGSGWDQISGALTNVSVASDGSVWGVNHAGQIWRYKGNNQWEQVPGGLKEVSIGREGLVWGVNSIDDIWRMQYAGTTSGTGTEASGALPLSGNTTNYGGDYGSASFARTSDGVVHVEGLVRSTNNQWAHVATLPEGARPPRRLIFNLNNHESTARVDVLTDGRIHYVASPGGLDHNWLSLTGIDFAVSAGSALPLSGNTTNYGGDYGNAAYVKVGDVVYVSGLIRSTNNQWGHVATLPEGCRPTRRLIFNLNNHESTARVDVLPNGQIHYVASPGGLDHNWLSLTGISFSVNAGSALALSSNTTNYGGDYGSASTSKRGRTVLVEGLVRSTDNQWGYIATLPEGSRPTKRLIFNLNNHESTARVDVLKDGRIQYVASPGGLDHNWLSLTGVQFEADGPPAGSGGGTVGSGGPGGGATPTTPSPVGGGGGGGSSTGTPTGSSTTVSELPQQLKSLGSLDVSVFFVTFDLPLKFLGDINVQPLSKAVTYAGRAELTAPFDVTVDPLAVSVFAADGDNGAEAGWMVKFGMPQSKTIKDVIQGQVLDRIPGEVKPVVDTLVMPYLSLYDNSTIILSNQDGEDDDVGSYIAGFNAFATLKASEITPFNLLNDTFPVLHLEQRSVVLGVGAATGSSGDFFVGAQLQLDVELGTPLIVFNSIGLNVSKASTDTSVGAQIEFTLNLDNEALKMRGGLTVTTGTGSKVTVWGALDVADGAWRDPFGIKGLTIGGLGVEIGATPTFPYVVLGVRGEVHIGDGLLGGRIGILIDASDWSKCILDIYSKEGIQVPRLVNALTGGWLDVSKVLDVSITDLQLYIAPKGGSIAGRSYDAGLEIGGKLDLWGYKAQVDGKLDYDSGGYLRGTMDPIRLRAGGVDFLSITNNAGSAGASIDFSVSAAKVGGAIDGKLVLLGGLYSSSVQAQLNSKGFTATVAGGGLGIYQSTSVTMQEGLFRLTYAPRVGVSVNIAGYTIGLSVGTSITTEITDTRFTQQISFSFSAMGRSYNLGPFTISVPFRSLEDLAKAFYDYARDAIVGGLIGSLKAAGEAAFNWVKSNVTQSAQAASKFFQDVGAKAEDIAKGTVRFMGATASDAVKYLGLGASESARILKDGFGWTVDQTGRWLKDVGGFADTAVDGALKGVGYAAGEVGDFMGKVFGGSWIPHVDVPYVDIIPHVDYVDLSGY
ncbi:MAG: hypothetical protein H6739_41835 [Alphaproteobacteria bacterium]|nr:hypothetical protein [Alphaproteobacteria bacterium]